MRVDSSTVSKALGMGAALSAANPKNLALTIAAAGSIAQAELRGAATVVAVDVFVVIGSLTVAGPVLWSVLAGERAASPLTSIKQLTSEHNAVIMMVVLLVLGAKLIGSRMTGLGN